MVSEEMDSSTDKMMVMKSMLLGIKFSICELL